MCCMCKQAEKQWIKFHLATQRHLINNFKNATELGGEVIQKKTDNIASAIIETVNEKEITTICLGQTAFKSFSNHFKNKCI